MGEWGDYERRIIDAWIVNEVLTPVTVRSWEILADEMGGTLIPNIEPVAPHPSSDQRKAWHVVVLGAIEAGPAYALINGVFAPTADEADEVEQADGQVIAATVTLDGEGRYLPESLNLAAFPWGLGAILRTSEPAPLREWEQADRSIRANLAAAFRLTSSPPPILDAPALASISQTLRDRLGLPSSRWSVVPAIISLWRSEPPQRRLLSSLLLPDLVRVRRAADDMAALPTAVASYLGATLPGEKWDPLTDRRRLADLASPSRFPLASWPAPGLHPLTLLQQTAVNAIARDLKNEGLAAVNGPPGTGKTTLLRDLVAHVMTQRAVFLARFDDPAAAIKDHVEGKAPLDLLNYAIVVGSSNNAAVENVTEAIPLRSAIDRSFWNKLSYFGGTADKALGVPAKAPPEKHAWGLVAARLGSASNRARFVEAAWFDDDWGLECWFNEVAWPGALRGSRPILSAEAPLGPTDAARRWQRARREFSAAVAEVEQLTALLNQARVDLARYDPIKRQCAELAIKVKNRAAVTNRQERLLERAEEWVEIVEDISREKKAALDDLEKQVPGFLHRLFNTKTAVGHRKRVAYDREMLKCLLNELGDRVKRRDALRAELARAAAAEQAARGEGRRLEAEEAQIVSRLRTAWQISGNSLPVDLWENAPDQTLFASAPWNGGAFQAARFRVFVAAVQLHRAFVEAAALPLGRSLGKAVDLMRGRTANHDADLTRRLWGLFFLLVPIVSSTFASFGRMFDTLGGRDLGWLLIDEAGQATPQAALGAIWRARRAVVIGDPQQIEPVVTLPERLGRRIYESLGIDFDESAAPKNSAQTLADRQSPISANFPGSKQDRQVGMPLLVHRRCEEPMFGLSNAIAYGGKMVLATGADASPIRSILGPSGWIDVCGTSDDKWVAAEAEVVGAAFRALHAAGMKEPDIYVITPFRMVATRLRKELLDRSAVLPHLDQKAKREWLWGRIGTVHTFQGREAEAVILMLGAGEGARQGSRDWASATPNLLNVAATRAKKAIYVVGNLLLWQRAGFFREAALRLETRPIAEVVAAWSRVVPSARAPLRRPASPPVAN